MLKSKKVILIIIEIIAILVVIGTLILSKQRVSEKKGKPTIGLILTGDKNDSGWNNAHYNAMTKVTETLDVNLLIKENIPEGTKKCIPVLDDMIDNGATTIFLAGYAYGEDIKQYSTEHKNIKFYIVDPSSVSKNIYSYFGRIYQSRYLSGIVAGSMTKTNSIGYIAAQNTPEVIRGIDAFTLGVRSINPKATVYVEWTDSWEDYATENENAADLIENYKADVLTYHQNRYYTNKIADKYGVYSIGYHYNNKNMFSDNYLAAVVWNFESIYTKCILNDITDKKSSNRIYWGGITDGIVDLDICSKKVPTEVVEKIEKVKKDFDSGWDVFIGPIYDNEGNLKVDADECLSDDYMLNKLVWLVDGVVEIKK